MYREVEFLTPPVAREDRPARDAGRWISHRSHLLLARPRALPSSAFQLTYPDASTPRVPALEALCEEKKVALNFARVL